MTKEQIVEAIYDATGPDQMGKEAAIEFMEDIIGDLQISIEALQDEIDG